MLNDLAEISKSEFLRRMFVYPNSRFWHLTTISEQLISGQQNVQTRTVKSQGNVVVVQLKIT